MDARLSLRERLWAWFQAHAQSPHALVWLGVVSFADSIFFPIPPEVFLVALMLAHPPRWKQYLLVALPASAVGGCIGYFIAHGLFDQFGLPILEFYNLQAAFESVQHVMRGHVFATMFLGNFSPIPDKVLIYAAGFLGVKFPPFILGYVAGRGVRMAVAMYLAGRYGADALIIIRRYLYAFAAAAVALATMYAMVHWHLLPL